MRRFIWSRIPPPPHQKKKQEEIVVLVLVVYDRCRPRGVGGFLPCFAYSGLWLWSEFGVFPPPPPHRPPLGADMLEMTTDAQEGSNKTLQGLINTMQSHSVVMRFEIPGFEITMIFYWINFIYGLKSPPLQVINDSLGNCFTCKR